MAADDKKSVIQFSRFLYRVFDLQNWAAWSESTESKLSETEIKVMDEWTVDLKGMW